jgi:hypothetical protein
MVQKARRENKYAGCSRIVPGNDQIVTEVDWRGTKGRGLSMNGHVVRKWTMRKRIFMDFCRRGVGKRRALEELNIDMERA